MTCIKALLGKIKKKCKNFIKNQCGGDVINQVLLLVIALVIIGLLLAFAINQFLLVKEGIMDLFSWGT